MYPLISAFLLVSLSSAEPWHAPDSCALELNRMHTVRIKENVYLLYGDPGLASYLQTVLGTPLSVSIVPVFTGEPVAILHDNMAIVSTGLILRARGEEDLREALRLSKPNRFRFFRARDRRAPVLPSCSRRISPESFEQHKSRLARDLRQYEEWITPRLRERPAVPVITE